MTEAQLLADITTQFKSVGTPAVTTPEDDKGVTLKIVNVFDTAENVKLAPSAICRNISYYVYHAEQPDEAAYYHIQSLTDSMLSRAVEQRVSEVTTITTRDSKLIELPPLK
jgi:hypothetical protein